MNKKTQIRLDFEFSAILNASNKWGSVVSSESIEIYSLIRDEAKVKIISSLHTELDSVTGQEMNLANDLVQKLKNECRFKFRISSEKSYITYENDHSPTVTICFQHNLSDLQYALSDENIKYVLNFECSWLDVDLENQKIAGLSFKRPKYKIETYNQSQG